MKKTLLLIAAFVALSFDAHAATFSCRVSWRDKKGGEHSFRLFENADTPAEAERQIVARYEENGNGEVSASCEPAR